MGNKHSKPLLRNPKPKQDIPKHFCQSCEETMLQLEYKNTEWGLSDNEYIKTWQTEKTCKNEYCKRYKK